MSATLMWEPKKRKAQSLPDALKFILQRGGLMEGRATYGEDSISYLQGLADAGVEGANELIEAIRKHREVEIWLEY